MTMLPPKSKLRALLEDFYKVARQSLSVVRAGGMAQAERATDARKALSAFVEKLTAFGQRDGATSKEYDF